MPSFSSKVSQMTGDFKLLDAQDIKITSASELPDGDVASGDLLIIDDGAAGTQASTKKVTVDAIATYVGTSLGGVLGISNDEAAGQDAQLTLTDGSLNILGDGGNITTTVAAGSGQTDDVNATITMSATPTFTSIVTPTINTATGLTINLDTDTNGDEAFLVTGGGSNLLKAQEDGTITFEVANFVIKDGGNNIATIQNSAEALHIGNTGAITLGSTATFEGITSAKFGFLSSITSSVQAQIDTKLTIADIDDTPVDSATTVPISSNWAHDHNAGQGAGKHVPASPASGQTTKFLDGNGNWNVPPGTYASATDVTGVLMTNFTNSNLTGGVNATDTLLQAIGRLDYHRTQTDGLIGVSAGAVLDALDDMNCGGANGSPQTKNIGQADESEYNTFNFRSNVVIEHDLTVSGTTTTLNTTELAVSDKIITLADGSNSAGAATGAGIEIDTDNSTKQPTLEWTNVSGLAQWGLYQEGDNTSYPIAVMTSMSDVGTAPSGNKAGVGTFCYNTADDALYIRTE